MLRELTDCSVEQAQAALAGADGKVKLAILLLRGMSRADAEGLLERSGGNLRLALREHG
jgi:N-acetylmuramic acid 6-phosphate etherase